MNALSAVAFFAALAFASAGLLVGPSANIIQGPSSRSTIVGPNGSAISAVAPAGQIITEEQPGVIAQTAPVLAHSASVWGGAPSLLSRSVLAAPGLIAGSPLLADGINTVVSGPSGIIARSDLAAPALLSGW